MNKKGFTLVELLTTIAIISLVMGIAVVSYTAIVNSSKMRVFKTYESTMHAEAISLMLEAVSDPSKSNYYPTSSTPKKLYFSDLEIEPIKNPINPSDTCPNSYVKVAKDTSSTKTDSLIYTVCLICPNSDYNPTGNEELCEVYVN